MMVLRKRAAAEAVESDKWRDFMKAKVVDGWPKNNKIRIHLSKTNAAQVNSLRRAILSDVPKMAITKVRFEQGVSEDGDGTIYESVNVLPDEVLAHRLAMIPVPTFLDEFEFPEDDINNMYNRLFGDKNPIMRSFETTAGRGLAGVITSLNFDWGLNDTINWDTRHFGHKAPKGCKISIAFTPIHDITPGLDSDGMIRAPVFNVAGSSPHRHEDVHPEGMDARVETHTRTMDDYMEDEP